MTTAADADLQAINHAIGQAESTADRGFFERLLAPAFSMIRPDGISFDDRSGSWQLVSWVTEPLLAPRPDSRPRTPAG